MSDTTPPAGGADTLTPQPTTTSTETTRTFVIGGAENRPADDVSIPVQTQLIVELCSR